MPEQKLPNAISEAALEVCSREELQQMSINSLRTLGYLIDKRLQKEGPPPSVDELLGIKELALEYLSHPALETMSKPLPDSPEAKSPTSD